MLVIDFSWMEACINEPLPATTELEEGLRNGVHLAKLGHFMAPEDITLKKIYDKDLARYEVILTTFVLCVIKLYNHIF